MQIANPIYDVVFKYLMEDAKVAKLLISSIIGEEIVELEFRPQEYTSDIDKSRIEGNVGTLTVYRLDFNARIKTGRSGDIGQDVEDLFGRGLDVKLVPQFNVEGDGHGDSLQ